MPVVRRHLRALLVIAAALAATVATIALSGGGAPPAHVTAHARVVATPPSTAGSPAVSAPAPTRTPAGSSCASHPRPGTMVAGVTPADLSAEYGVLGRPPQTVDRLASRWLRSLPVSGIVVSGTRFLARATYGDVYIVSARHLLAFPLVPDRCLPAAKRAVERSLEHQLRRQYAHQALCLVIVSRTQANPFCGAAPGTFDPLQYAPGTPGFGIVPDGVAAVRIRFSGSTPRTLPVRRNLWIFNDPHLTTPPCGLEWLDDTGMVLRTIQQCTRNST